MIAVNADICVVLELLRSYIHIVIVLHEWIIDKLVLCGSKAVIYSEECHLLRCYTMWLL
jgi:hypothetical protein